MVGGILGALGATVFVQPAHLTAVATDVHAIVGVFVGILIVGLGVRYLIKGSVAGGGVRIPVLGALLARAQQKMLSRVDRWVGDYRIAGLGAAYGLFPCPLLYPAFLYAFVQGSPIGGAIALGALGIGTIPAVFGMGILTGSIDLTARRRLHRLLGIAFVLLGYIPLQHGLATLGIPLPHPPIPYYQPL